MMDIEHYTVELSGIIEASLLAEGNTLAEKLGFGSIFTVKLSATGNEPATHYGFHTWVRPSFMDTLNISRTDNDPDKIKRRSSEKIISTAKEKQALGGAIFFNGGFEAMLRQNGLKRIVGKLV